MRPFLADYFIYGRIFSRHWFLWIVSFYSYLSVLYSFPLGLILSPSVVPPVVFFRGNFEVNIDVTILGWCRHRKTTCLTKIRRKIFQYKTLGQSWLLPSGHEIWMRQITERVYLSNENKVSQFWRTVSKDLRVLDEMNKKYHVPVLYSKLERL